MSAATKKSSAHLLSGLSLRHVSAGFIAVLVGYSSSAAIIFAAINSVTNTPSEVNSWMWALGIGMGSSTLVLSIWYRLPLLTAWSTPGAALLVTSLVGIELGEAIAAFLLCGLLICIVGYAGWMDRFMSFMPLPLASAMLAGVLLQFGLDAFAAIGQQPALVIPLLVAFIVLRQFIASWTIPLLLLLGTILAYYLGLIDVSKLSLQLARPQWMQPQFNIASIFNIAIPLFIVTMASQNIPGAATLKTHGYHQAPIGRSVGLTGIVSMLLAPFGGFAFNLAAITAALCMNDNVDPDPAKRYLACLCASAFYFLAGIFGATIANLFFALPSELIAAIAGFALLSTIANALQLTVADAKERDTAIMVFLVTASGVSLLGIGSAFWALLLGLSVRAYKQRVQS